MAVGRFAPTPSGPLHLGNLRTALIAWLAARSTGSAFILRVEDLDPNASKHEYERTQQLDLASLGIDWDPPVLRQSERFDVYSDAIDELDSAGLLYPCYCTRREIRQAASAPHGTLPEGAYPGTCRDLDANARSEHTAAGRPPALRLRASGMQRTFADVLHGEVRGTCDDFVVRRNDGVAAYNLAVVFDDAASGVEEVVRGNDLLPTTVRQIVVAELLDLPQVRYAHVPLVLGPGGERLAKRDGAVTMDELRALGDTPERVLVRLAASVGLCEPSDNIAAPDLVPLFALDVLPREPVPVAALAPTIER